MVLRRIRNARRESAYPMPNPCAVRVPSQPDRWSTPRRFDSSGPVHRLQITLEPAGTVVPWFALEAALAGLSTTLAQDLLRVADQQCPRNTRIQRATNVSGSRGTRHSILAYTGFIGVATRKSSSNCRKIERLSDPCARRESRCLNPNSPVFSACDRITADASSLPNSWGKNG